MLKNTIRISFSYLLKIIVYAVTQIFIAIKPFTKINFIAKFQATLLISKSGNISTAGCT